MLNRLRHVLLTSSPLLLLACTSATGTQQAPTASAYEPAATEVAPQVADPIEASPAEEDASGSQSTVFEGTVEEPVLEVLAALTSFKAKSVDVGSVHFVAVDDAVEISGSFQGLPPGTHALKILEARTCAALGPKVADFNPTAAKHGPIASSERHVGDLGNIEVSKTGEASFEMTTDSMTVEPDAASSVLGHALVVTRHKDDGKSQPDGRAGKPIACGIIGSNQSSNMEISP